MCYVTGKMDTWREQHITEPVIASQFSEKNCRLKNGPQAGEL
jgi:hypothetical protein